MVLGTLGSTLNDELNRLANGGTYRDSSAMVDEALAAKQWANRENITPYSTDTVGVLNEIAGLGLDKKNWLDFNGICNYIGGTSGLPAAAALRQIYPTTDLLTGVASYYTDAATPRYNYPGFITFDGTTSNYISVPDETALDITGDLDLRARVALDDWTPATEAAFVGKWNSAGNQRSYMFSITGAGLLSLYWTTDGATTITRTATVVSGIADGATKWVRATLDVNNGASGHDVKFFTSDNGTSWTQLGSTVTTAGTTSVYSGTALATVGAFTPGTSGAFSGKAYNAQIFASINDTDKRLDVDLTTNVTSATYDQFTATTGQLCTINGQNTLTNGGSAGALLPTTVGSSLAADSNDAKFLAHDGTNYVYNPGVTGNTMSVPNSAALQITGDLDLRAYIAMDDWTPATTMWFVYKIGAGADGYSLALNTNGTLALYYNGSTIRNSTVATGAADGSALWVRVTFDVDNGASGNDVKFYTSPNGSTWTQLGATVTNAGIATIATGTDVLSVTTNPFAGKMYRAQVYSDITETTKVLDVDTSVITAGSATSFTAVTGQTVTINRSTSGRKTVAVTQPTWLFGTDDYMEVNNRYMAHSTSDENYVYLSGNTGNYMSVADNPPLDVVGDIDIQFKVAMDDWTPSNLQTIISKYTNPNRSWGIEIQDGSVFTAGIIRFVWSENGTTTKAANSTVATGLADGATKWIRVTLDVDNGASGNDVKFFTSDDGTNWTQLGTTVTQAGVTSIYSGTSPLWIGSLPDAGSRALKGKFFRAIIKNGIDGTTVLDANAAVITLPSQTTFVDSSSNAYTVTINKSGVGTFVSTGNYLYLPGVTSNTASTLDAAALDIVGDIDVRVKVAMDDWTPAAVSTLAAKWQVSGNQRSWRFNLNTNGGLFAQWSENGTNELSHFIGSIGITDGAVKWVRWTLDVDNGASGNDSKFFTSDDGTNWTQVSTTQTTAGVTSIYNSTASLEIGAIGGAVIARGKFFRAQVLNGIGGTVAFDANFEESITSLNQASFTESSSNAATVTINRSGSTFRSAGVIDAGYLYPGATNTFSNSTTSFLDFGASDSFTLVAVARQWATPTNFGRIIDKGYGATAPGYALIQSGTSASFYSQISNGTNTANTSSTPSSIPAGAITLLSAVVNRATNTLQSYSNTTGSTTASISTVGAIPVQTYPLTLGKRSDAAAGFVDMEFIAAAVFRSVLTATQIRQITNYFANREVYL